jgi:hypothetical protein
MADRCSFSKSCRFMTLSQNVHCYAGWQEWLNGKYSTLTIIMTVESASLMPMAILIFSRHRCGK